jgi:hypothetical protein
VEVWVWVVMEEMLEKTQALEMERTPVVEMAEMKKTDGEGGDEEGSDMAGTESPMRMIKVVATIVEKEM